MCGRPWISAGTSVTKSCAARLFCMPSPDVVRLKHMREAAMTALEMGAGHIRTPEICARFPAIPVPKMIAVRNRLVHAYFDVDLDIVWTTVNDDLPALLPALDEALASIDSR